MNVKIVDKVVIKIKTLNKEKNIALNARHSLQILEMVSEIDLLSNKTSNKERKQITISLK